MIRINLLEVREERRRIALRNLAAFVIVMLLTTGGVLYLWHSGLTASIDETSALIQKTRQDIAKLEKIVGEVEKIKDQKKDLENKLEVIRSLEAGRVEIVDLLLAIAEVLSEEIWVDEIVVKGRNVELKAFSIDMQSIGVLVKKMKTDPRFSTPKTSDIKVGGSGRKDSGGAVGFKLSVEFIPPQAPANEQARNQRGQ